MGKKCNKSFFFRNPIQFFSLISYDFDQKNYMFWKLVNSFKNDEIKVNISH